MSVTEDKLGAARTARTNRTQREAALGDDGPTAIDRMRTRCRRSALRWSSLYQMLGDSPKTPYAGEKPRSFLKPVR